MSTAAPELRRRHFRGTVRVNEPICREHYRLRIALPAEPAFPPTEPGQFVQMACGPVDYEAIEDHTVELNPAPSEAWTGIDLAHPTAFLRRPYSIAARHDSDAGTEIDLIYRVAGLGTEGLERMKPGAPASLIGPLGNRFMLTEGKSIGLLVGGGVGLPPMFYLAEHLWEEGWSGCGFVGAQTADLLAVKFNDTAPDEEGLPALCVQQFTRCGMPAVITTDDGSSGLHGRITEGLRRYLQDLDEEARSITVIFVCGPDPMMHAVADLAAEFDIEAQACLEQPMACGMATCQSCVVRVRGVREAEEPHGRLEDGTPWRYRLACTDGPVFHTRDVIW